MAYFPCRCILLMLVMGSCSLSGWDSRRPWPKCRWPLLDLNLLEILSREKRTVAMYDDFLRLNVHSTHFEYLPKCFVYVFKELKLVVLY